MKRILQGILVILLVLPLALFAQDRVSVSGRRILLNGNLYQIRGVCYSPHAIGAPEWIPDFSKVGQDISLMKNACINTIRTYRPIQDKAVLDAFANAGIKIIIGFTLEETRTGSYTNYINTYKTHPAILMWVHGNEFNYHPDWFGNNLNNWYSILNTAAGNTKAIDLNHPVATVHGELPPASAISACPNVEVWGMNIYRKDNPGPLYSDWAARSGKPMFIAESGADSYPNASVPARVITNIWATVNTNGTWQSSNAICSGITFFAWVDEWWKSGDNANQNTGGFPNGGVPDDGFANEEYWGVLDIHRNIKPGYTSLKNAFCSVAPPPNAAPSAVITSPVNNASYTAPAGITINANASDTDGSISKVEFFQGNTKLGEDLSSPYSFSWQNVPAGSYSLTVRATDNSGATGTSAAVTVNVSNSTSQSPYGGTAAMIPGRIEAERYDVGGSNIAYFDGSSGNTGGQFRTDQVDIESTTDAGAGYNVGWTAAGEWLEYTVTVNSAGKYDFRSRVASTMAGKNFHIEMNGINVTGLISVPNTGGWQNWQTVTVSGINLNAGIQIMRIYFDTDGFNLNYVDVSASTITPNASPTISLTSPSNNASYNAPATVTMSANASDSDGSISKVEFYQGSVKLGEDLSSPYSFSWSNVGAGTYAISARAIDNLGAVTNSAASNITVNGTSNPTTCKGGVSNGDYTYEVTGAGSTSTIKFIPGAPIAGTNMVILYYRIGTGGYAGIFMDASGSNYVKSINVATGSAVTFYFTYRVGTTTAERNSSATPHTFTAGGCGAVARLFAEPEETAGMNVYPNPTTADFNITFESDKNEQVEISLIDKFSHTVFRLYTEASEGQNIIPVIIGNLDSGIYSVVIKRGNNLLVQKIVVAK